MALEDALKPLSGNQEEDELKKKANLAGIATQPTTAVGAKLIGGTSKQQEMAASKQAKIGQQNQLGTALRTQSSKVQEGLVEQDSRAAIADKVSNIADKFKNADVTGAVMEGLTDPLTGQAVDVKEAMDQFKAGEITEEQLSAQYGREVANQMMSDFQQGLTDTAQDAAQVNVNELFEPAEITEIANSLGISVEEVEQIGLEGIENKLAEIEQQEFQDVENMRGILTAPTSSEADKQYAREQLRIMGASHLIASDAQIDKIIEEVNSGQSVVINGQEIPLSELMESDQFAGALSHVVNQLEVDPDLTAKDLQVDEQLFNWVKGNLDGMIAIMEDTKGAYAEAGETFAATKEFMSTIGEDLFNALGLDKYSVDNYREGDLGNALRSLEGMEAVDIQGFFNDLSVIASEDRDAALGIMATQLEEGDAQAIAEQAANLEILNNAKAPEQAILAVSNVKMSNQNLQQIVEEATKFPDAYSKISDFLSIVDEDGDGQMDVDAKDKMKDYVLAGGKEFDLSNFTKPYTTQMAEHTMTEWAKQGGTSNEELAGIMNRPPSTSLADDIAQATADKTRITDDLAKFRAVTEDPNHPLYEHPLMIAEITKRENIIKGLNDRIGTGEGAIQARQDLRQRQITASELNKQRDKLREGETGDLQTLAITYRDHPNPAYARLAQRASEKLAERNLVFDPRLKVWRVSSANEGGRSKYDYENRDEFSNRHYRSGKAKLSDYHKAEADYNKEQYRTVNYANKSREES